MSNCGCPQTCPDLLDKPENLGCLENINSDCILYSGEDVDCFGMTKGDNLSEILKNMTLELCNIDNILNNLTNFNCSQLSNCSIANLGDVAFNNLNAGQYLKWTGVKWINSDLVVPPSFSCNDLATCSLNSLGDVNVSSPLNGQVLTYQGNKWISSSIPTSPTITSDNGITKTLNNFQLGGLLTQNTVINGGNFDLSIGASANKLNHLYGRSTVLDLSSDIISLNTSTEPTQTEGLRYLKLNGNISIGKNVFNAINTYIGNNRIGNNITINKTGLLDPLGFFIGGDISIDSSICYAMGSNMNLSNFFGVSVGTNNKASGFIGGTMLGSDLEIQGGSTGNQSAFVYGSNVSLTFASLIQQSSLVFNPTNRLIKSSSIGNGTDEKIRVDVVNGFITTFNASDYYFFTDVNDTDGWNVNNSLVRFNKNFIKISQSSGNVAEQKSGCIRYNQSLNKMQVFTGSSWETITSV